jgi:hypothetical protein
VCNDIAVISLSFVIFLLINVGDGATCTVYGVSTRYAIKKMELTEDFDDKDAIINREPRFDIVNS